MSTLPARQQPTSNLPDILRNRVIHSRKRMYAAFNQVPGLSHINENGTVFAPRFLSIRIVNDRFVVFVLDLQRLYHIPLARLRKPEVMDRLSQAVHAPVRLWDLTSLGHGLSYVMDLAAQPRVELPRSVALELGDLPDGQWLVPIGYSRSGTVFKSLPTLGHSLVGGTSRFGKTNFVQGILAALAAHHSPEQIRIAVIDAKGTDYGRWSRLPHLWAPIAVDLADAQALAEALCAEMDRRFRQLFPAVGASNWIEYNEKADQPIAPIFVVVDEFVDFVLLQPRGINGDLSLSLVRLASKAAGAGIFLCVAATNPDAKTIHTGIRKNCATRIAFQCTEDGQSITILERPGAERLPMIPGRLLAKLPDRPAEVIEMQAMYLSGEELDRIAAGLNLGVQPAVPTLHCASAASASVEVIPALSGIEIEMVRFAVAHDGSLSTRQLYPAFVSTRRLSEPQLRETLRRWEEAGWTTPSKSNRSRRIRPVLAELAGVAFGG